MHVVRQPAYAPRDSSGWAIVGMIGLAIVVRVVIALNTYGTNDIDTWRHLASTVAVHGLPATYEHEKLLNHPPLAILWAVGCWHIHQMGYASFELLIKLPAIFADAVSCWLLWRYTRPACGWLYAVSPIALAISGYHGNTDNVYAMLTLAACVRADRGDARRAGLLLGLALNVKVIPILLLPALLLTQRSRRDAGQFTIGLLLGAMPIVMALLVTGPVMAQRLFGYGSNYENWGIVALTSLLSPTGSGNAIAHFYHDSIGRYVMGVAILLAAIIAKHQRQTTTTAATIAASLFIVLAPGFGVQYLVLPCLLILACAPRAGLYAQFSAGLFVWMTYYQFMNHAGHPKSTFTTIIQSPAAIIGLFAWSCLAIAAGWLLTRRSSGASTTVLHLPESQRARREMRVAA